MQKESHVNNSLKVISRVSAWALLIGIVVLAVSGWGITRTEVVYDASLGLVDRRLADYVHRVINIPVAIFFLTHVLTRVHLALSERHPGRARLTGSLIAAAGILLFTAVLYMELIA